MDKDRKYAKMEAKNLFDKWFKRLHNNGTCLNSAQDLIRVNINENNAIALEEATVSYYNKVKEILNND